MSAISYLRSLNARAARAAHAHSAAANAANAANADAAREQAHRECADLVRMLVQRPR